MSAQIQPAADLLAGLNGPQLQAVTHGPGPMLIVAGGAERKDWRIFRTFQLGQVLGARSSPVVIPPYYYSIGRIRYVLAMSTTIPFLALAVVGLFLALANPRRNVSLLTGWSVLLLAFSNPYAVPVPWSSLIDFVTVLTILFTPGSVRAGMVLAYRCGRATVGLHKARAA